jgi:hypothetical protein
MCALDLQSMSTRSRALAKASARLIVAAFLPRTHGKASSVWIDLANAVRGFRTPDETRRIARREL